MSTNDKRTEMKQETLLTRRERNSHIMYIRPETNSENNTNERSVNLTCANPGWRMLAYQKKKGRVGHELRLRTNKEGYTTAAVIRQRSGMCLTEDKKWRRRQPNTKRTPQPINYTTERTKERNKNQSGWEGGLNIARNRKQCRGSDKMQGGVQGRRFPENEANETEATKKKRNQQRKWRTKRTEHCKQANVRKITDRTTGMAIDRSGHVSEQTHTSKEHKGWWAGNGPKADPPTLQRRAR